MTNMGAIPGSREPSPTVSALTGFDPERGCIYFLGEIRHGELGDWHKVCTEPTEGDAASWAAAQCFENDDEWRVVMIVEQEVARG